MSLSPTRRSDHTKRGAIRRGPDMLASLRRGPTRLVSCARKPLLLARPRTLSTPPGGMKISQPQQSESLAHKAKESAVRLTREEYGALARDLDLDCDGRVSQSEFLAAGQRLMEQRVARDVFLSYVEKPTSYLDRLGSQLLNVLDYCGTALFAAVGVQVAGGEAGMNIVGCTLVGCIAAMGGGTVNNLLVRETPTTDRPFLDANACSCVMVGPRSALVHSVRRGARRRLLGAQPALPAGCTRLQHRHVLCVAALLSLRRGGRARGDARGLRLRAHRGAMPHARGLRLLSARAPVVCEARVQHAGRRRGAHERRAALRPHRHGPRAWRTRARARAPVLRESRQPRTRRARRPSAKRVVHSSPSPTTTLLVLSHSLARSLFPPALCARARA